MARYDFYHTDRWRKLRQYVIDRDGGMCVHCGRKGNIVHHIVWVNDDNVDDDSVVFNPDNLECVCVDCHAAIHSGGKRPTAEGWVFDDEGNLVWIGDTSDAGQESGKGK